MSASISKERLAAWWASLSPDKRKTLMGVGCLAVLLLVLYLFVSAGPEPQAKQRGPTKADIHLLTGQDTRTLGLEAVGAELRDAQRRQRELEGQLQRLTQEAGTKEELRSLSAQLTAIAESIKDGGTARARTLEELRRPSSSASPSTAVPAPHAVDRTNANAPSELNDPTRRAVPSSTKAPRSEEPPALIKIQVFGETAAQALKPPAAIRKPVDLPAGSVLRGVLLTGVDAPTGMQSKRDPIPVLMRIKHEAILPNRFSADVKECFVVLAATGDLSTERAMMRAETLSCVRQNGEVIESVLDAYALGDDGKAGIRGRLVSRNGAVVAKAAAASFAEALSQIFRPVAIQGFNTSPGQRTEFQAPPTSDALEAAGYAGFGGAMRRLSDYYVDLADEIVPFIEVDAAREIEAVLLKSVSMTPRSAQS
jgi:conjugal transfer pilus assembly protein TraB